jgi:site-specific DNA-methyltransferase (cytosine-N4-specific)
MKKLIEDSEGFYTPKKRASGHDISDQFGRDNCGAIPSNSLQIPNTESNSAYLRYCKLVGATGHPARFPIKLPEFFIEFLTDEKDMVLDIFAGSNTTGAAAEGLGRRWIAFEKEQRYLATSAFRFLDDLTNEKIVELYYSLIANHTVNIEIPQRLTLFNGK